MNELEEISQSLADIKAQLEEAQRPGAPPPANVGPQMVAWGALIPVIIQAVPAILEAVIRLVEAIKAQQAEGDDLDSDPIAQ